MRFITKIKDIFYYDIERKIQSVIKVSDDRYILQEINEYILTDMLESLIIDYFEAFTNSFQMKSDNVGVWISGDFGSGKSHFAKICGILLSNRNINDIEAIARFNGILAGTPKENEIKGYLHQIRNFSKNNIIMFQIGAEAGQVREDEMPIIFYKQFLISQGFSSDIFIAKLEKDLIQKGKFEEFKENIQKIQGQPWEEFRNMKLLIERSIGEALYEIFPGKFRSIDEAKREIEKIRELSNLTISDIAKELNEFLVKKSEEDSSKIHNIIFIVDEVGQFIGNSDKKLLDLQSMVEEFGKIADGRIWVVVTAQASLTEIISSVKKKEAEYKRLRARFDTRLHLTSENLEEVIEKRILKKKEQSKGELKEIYSKFKGKLTNLSIIEGTNRPLKKLNKVLFINYYPFLPYQIQITQSIFLALKPLNGKTHKFTAERSMIGVTHGVFNPKKTNIAGENIGRLVTMDEIYDQIEVDLPPNIKTEIGQLKGRLVESIEISKILKIIYLLSRLEWIPLTSENVTKMFSKYIDSDFNSLKLQIEAVLKELIDEKYIIEEDNNYKYITGLKKQFETRVGEVNVKTLEKRQTTVEFLNEIISPFNKLRHEAINEFYLTTYSDENLKSKKGEVSIHFFSPLSLELDDITTDKALQESYSKPYSICWLSSENQNFEKIIDKLIRIEKVVKERRLSNISLEEELILKEKRIIAQRLRNNIETQLKSSLRNGKIVHDGDLIDLTGDSSSDLNNIFSKNILEILFKIYTKYKIAAYKVDQTSIKKILNPRTKNLYEVEEELDLFDTDNNINLFNQIIDEILTYIKYQLEISNTLTGKEVIDHFQKIEYGWNPILVRFIISSLFRAGIISIEKDGKIYYDSKVKAVEGFFFDMNKFKKLLIRYEEEEVIELKDRRNCLQDLKIIFNIEPMDTINDLSINIAKSLKSFSQDYNIIKAHLKSSKIKIKEKLRRIPEYYEEVKIFVKPSKTVKYFLDTSEEIKENQDYYEIVKDFINKDKLILFDKILKISPKLEIRSVDIDSNLINEYETFHEEIDLINNNAETIEKWGDIIKSYNSLLYIYKDIYQELHGKRFEEYTKLIEEIKESEDLKDQVKPETFKSYNEQLCNIFKWDQKSYICENCKTEISKLDNHILAIDRERTKLIKQLSPKTTTGPNVIDFRIHSVIKKKTIKSNGDIENLIEKIRRKLEELLKKYDQIHLK